MTGRRSIVDGMNVSDPKDESQRARELLRLSKTIGAEFGSPAAVIQQVTRAPISTRMRTDFQAALKRASLENQLAGREPSTVQDILEKAVEPWLKQHGYLN